MRSTAVVTMLLLVILVCASSHVQSATELEIFAGQDKTCKVNDNVPFSDARIIKPNPLDPERTYIFQWDFDDRVDSDQDGSKDNDVEREGQFTSWRFTHAGTFFVTLWVYDGIYVAKDTLQVTVLENHPPVLEAAPFQIAPLGIPYEYNVTVSDADDELSSLSWSWVLDDGYSSKSPPPLEHAYEMLGEYHVTVRVTDPSGNVVGTTFQVDVVDATRPECDAGPDVVVQVNATVHFDGTGSRDNVGVTTWSWTFEYDGAIVSLSGPVPNHTFTIPGTYLVGLRVTDAASNKASDTMMVFVRSPGGDDQDGDAGKVQLELRPKVWREETLVVIVVTAFLLSILVNLRRAAKTSSSRDRKVFYKGPEADGG